MGSNSFRFIKINSNNSIYYYIIITILLYYTIILIINITDMDIMYFKVIAVDQNFFSYYT